MHLRPLTIFCLCLLLASMAPAQDEPDSPVDPERAREEAQEVIPPQEPMNPREELFLAIELKDLAAARRALEQGADLEINDGVPSALATAALYDDLRMVDLLLEFGADPVALEDSPLEEAIRRENARMVELLMRSGARVPPAAAGQQLFRLAQRGDGARRLSEILLDHGADPNLCLAAATVGARIDLMKLCLGRQAEVGELPAELNALSVALASGEPEILELILAQGPGAETLAGALVDAIAAGRMDLVQRAVAAGARPAYEHVEAAIDNGQTEICLFLLEQSPPDDPSLLAGGDAAALIQRASDLGFEEIAEALERKSGVSVWQKAPWLPTLAGVLLAAVLGGLALNWLIRGRRAASAGVPAAGVPAAGVPPTRLGGVLDRSPRAPAPTPPASPQKQSRPAPAAAASSSPVEPAAPSPAGDGGWQLVPEPVAEALPAGLSEEPLVASVGGDGAPAAEIQMPAVDLSRDAAAVFAAARQASSGETVRPDAPDRRQLVLVTPSRVTMLHSCPAPGSLASRELAAAERIAPASPARNIAVIAYTELDPMSTEVTTAIPFFDLLQKLGYLGHAVWIFEGHVSAMAPGCQDADVLIVDDGMMPYLPGNWRSVATRAMRGNEVHLFERKTGALRKL